jgi:hypothetical protein
MAKRGYSKTPMLRNLNAVLVAAVLCHASVTLAAGQVTPEGCRLADDDPLRVEVNRMMKDGIEFEEQQKAALEDKVGRLGQARGWSKSQESDFMRKVVFAGNNESWEQTLAVVAAFVRVCEEQADGNQRAEAIRLFRELYAVEAKQWQSIHDAVDREIAATKQESEN